MDARFARSLFLTLGLALTAAAPGLEIGQPPSDLAFKDIRYLPRTLNEFGERAALVFVFTTLDADNRDAMNEQLTRMHGSYESKNVEIATVNVSPHETIREVALHGIENNLPFTLLYDLDAKGAQALGVSKVGTAVVLDGKQFALRYRGDLAGLEAALEAVLEGQPAPEADTSVLGPDIPVREVPDPSSPITYTEHIAPVMNAHCVSCHRPGQAAPFSLLSYGQVSARADMIREVVLEERMPPWYGAREHGPFENERKVTEPEKTRLLQWLEAGKPEGDPDRKPAAPEFPDSEWAIGEPDLVLTAEEDEAIPADGYIPYRYVTLPYQFPADTWIQGLEILPGNPEVVHHANLIYVQHGEEYDEQYGFLTGKVPGGGPVDLPAGVGMVVPKDSVLTLQIHYVTTGQPETDRMRVGFRYARGTIVKRTRHQRIRPEEIAIPPGEPFHRLSAEETIEHNATVLALFTHMHLRGRDMTFYADYPDGASETLLTVPNYSFDWQLAYVYPPGAKRFPKGTTIRTVSHYDNSPFNPYNPDPTVEVNYGDQTYHEMNDGYIFYLDEEEQLNLQIDPKTGQAIDKVAGVTE